MKIISQLVSHIDQDFGESFHIDISTGHPQILEDEFFIHNWIWDLIDTIGMKICDGVIHMKYYQGRDHTTEGWSCSAFLDTSSFTMHTSPHNCKLYVDIFSCKSIDIKKVNDYIKKTINATAVNFVKLNR